MAICTSSQKMRILSMSDNQTETNYQDILDKYAASIQNTEEAKNTDISEIKSEMITDVNPENPIPLSENPVEITPVDSIVPDSTENKDEAADAQKIEAGPEPVAEIPQSLPPKENNFFKYLFFFSLVIFIIVLVSVIFSFVNSQKDSSSNSSTVPTVAPTETANSSSCEINGENYQIGESFTATDGCNTCTCNPDMTIVCTEKTCPASTSSVKLSPTKSATTSVIPADWKTYSNSKFAFSFRYPKTLSYITDDTDKFVENGINDSKIMVQNFDGNTQPGDKADDFQILILIANKNGEFNMENISSPVAGTINGISVTKGTTTIKMVTVPVVIFNTTPNKVAFILTTPDSNQSNLFTQIISTFKIIP